jgi:hypothetical protein
VDVGSGVWVSVGVEVGGLVSVGTGVWVAGTSVGVGEGGSGVGGKVAVGGTWVGVSVGVGGTGVRVGSEVAEGTRVRVGEGVRVDTFGTYSFELTRMFVLRPRQLANCSCETETPYAWERL